MADDVVVFDGVEGDGHAGLGGELAGPHATAQNHELGRDIVLRGKTDAGDTALVREQWRDAGVLENADAGPGGTAGERVAEQLSSLTAQVREVQASLLRAPGERERFLSESPRSRPT